MDSEAIPKLNVDIDLPDENQDSDGDTKKDV